MRIFNETLLISHAAKASQAFLLDKPCAKKKILLQFDHFGTRHLCLGLLLYHACYQQDKLGCESIKLNIVCKYFCMGLRVKIGPAVP